MTSALCRVAILSHHDRETKEGTAPENGRFAKVFPALSALGAKAEAVLYHDDCCDAVRRRLLQFIATVELPVLWDADFLLGPKDASGEDSYVLCEINVSSVSPFPDSAAPLLARAALDLIRVRSPRRSVGSAR
jgi:hypothetical protein